MARTTLDTYRGGALTLQEGEQPKRLHYPCLCNGCPMPGTLFTAGTDKPGICAWHYGANPSDLPRITQVLNDWSCVTFEVNEGRRALTGEAAADPAALDALYRDAQERLQPLAGEHWANLQPRRGERYGAWANRLEAFVGGLVRDSLSLRRRATA